MRRIIHPLLFMLMLLKCGPVSALPGDAVRLAGNGRALLPIVTGEKAGPEVSAAAAELAAMLGRISGGTFVMQRGGSGTGIYVGMPQDFSALPIKTGFNPADPQRQEEYLLQSDGRSLYLVGATVVAVEDAVWDLLYRLGYRQFFPGETWEILPHRADISLAVNDRQLPDYLGRVFWYGHGTAPWNAEKLRQWERRNRARRGTDIKANHAYGAIISACKSEFAAHPEYLSLVKGARKGNKFCTSNPGLQRLVVDYTISRFEKEPGLQSVSLEPSDGGGWCECPACAALGSPSNQAVLLANKAAAAVQERFPGKFVAILAYFMHAPPPTIKVHPQVAVTVTYGLNTGSLTPMELLSAWQKQGVRVQGISYNVGGSRALADFETARKTFAEYNRLGARLTTIDMGDNWGSCGLGAWLLSRVLWDLDEGGRIDALTDEFLRLSFGPAREPMGRFFRTLYRFGPNDAVEPLNAELLGSRYRCLSEALHLADTLQVRARIGDLIKYTRYLELLRTYQRSEGAERQLAFEALMLFVWRIRDTGMIHTKAIYYDWRHNNSVFIPAEAGAPEGQSPWKHSLPFTDAELQGIVREGIAAYPVPERGFKALSFSDDLLPARNWLPMPDVKPGSIWNDFMASGRWSSYLWVEKAPADINLRIRPGQIYGNRGCPRLALYAYGDPAQETADSNESLPPDNNWHELTLKSSFAGLHRLDMFDNIGGTSVVNSDATQPWSFSCAREASPWARHLYYLYFYVPKGTETVGGYTDSGLGSIQDAAGKTLFTGDKEAGYFAVPVPVGQDGKFWKLHHCRGRWQLMTVPPWLATRPDLLLLPREVLERDGVRQ